MQSKAVENTTIILGFGVTLLVLYWAMNQMGKEVRGEQKV
jgi:hypothetical protein